MKTYETSGTWKQINRFLPEDIGITADVKPAESEFPWRKSSIHLERFANPESPVRLLLHHGVGTNGRLLSMIAGAALARRGFEVTAIDMPLYGMTENNERLVTYEDWIDISLKFIDAEYQRDPRPIVLYGLSAGGMLTYHVAALEPRVRGIIGMCFLDLRDSEVDQIISKFPLPAISEAVGGFVLGLLSKTPLKRMYLPLRYLVKMSALTNPPEAQAILIKDKTWGGSSVPLAFLTSTMGYKAAVPPEKFTSCPVLLTQPDEDHWTPLMASAKFFDKLACEKHLVMLKGAGHYPLEEEGLRQMHDAIDKFLKAVAETESQEDRQAV
nr:alpha/beta hydrolase [Leisingera sp. MMG026]